MPWLYQGTTWPGPDGSFDLGLAGQQPSGSVLDRWWQLRSALGAVGVIHARQVHGARVRVHDVCPEGILLQEGVDGHVTLAPGLALTVSVADCVPVFLVEPERHAVGLLHAGWRGIAEGIVEAGVRAMAGSGIQEPGQLLMHLGPAICGECYEVGPEVFERLKLPTPVRASTVDLRSVVRRRAIDAGLDPGRITTSGHCTRCGPGRFFSHRAGAAGRQVAFIGVRRGP